MPKLRLPIIAFISLLLTLTLPVFVAYVDGSIIDYTGDFGDGNITTETNPAILRVSLPDGTYVGSNPDKWLDECWLLNISSHSGTFTLRINNTSTALTSYDTHLIIALNDAGYNNLLSLTVNAVTIPKDTFKNGEPKPYNLYTWPSGDVYPTWFNDTLVNVDTIPPKGYVDVTVSVAFSNATDARIHFDAYGSKCPVPPPPDVKGKVTRNPLSEDSTVIFSPPPPPPKANVTFAQVGVDTHFTGTMLTVDGVNYTVAELPKTFTWDVGSEHTFEYHSPLVVVVNGKQHLWTHTTGLSTARCGTIIVPSEGGTVTGHYKIQFYLTVVSPHGTPGGEGWYDKDSTAYAMVTPLTVSGPPGVRYVFTHWSGDATGNTSPSHPITMNAPKTAIANWKTEYRLTVRTSGLGAYTTNVYNGTTLLGNASDATPYTKWFEEGSLILLNIDSPIVDGSKRFIFTQWSGDATGTSRPVSVAMNAPKDITANYKTQYQITVTASPNQALGGTFRVTYTQCGTTYTNVQKTTPWTEWVDAGTTVTVSEPQDIISISPGMRYKFDSYNPSASVAMTQAKTIILVYKTQYYLTVRVEPPGITTIPGEGWYNATLTASLLAPPVPNYEFKNWTVDGSFVPGNPINVPMDNPHTAIAYYAPIGPLSVSITPTTEKIKVGESVTFRSSALGGKPPYSYQWYLNGSAVSGATSQSWTFTPTATGYYIVYLKVTDATPQTVNSNEASVTVAPPLTVSISPMSASIVVGQSVVFTSDVSGGYLPYSYQWCLNDAPVPGATSSTWTFTPTTSDIYYVHLKVIDANNNVVQSEKARISVASAPIGGYSISLAKQTSTSHIAAYTMLIALFAVAMSLTKRKRK